MKGKEIGEDGNEWRRLGFRSERHTFVRRAYARGFPTASFRAIDIQGFGTLAVNAAKMLA